jgi:hypothetical protein
VKCGAGSLELSARRAGERTVLERIRYDGIARCSRAFARGDAALVVLSQLGPGVVHGDDVVTTGTLQPGAHLIVTGQTTTRLLGGALPSRANVTWLLGSGAFLETIGEPIIASPGAFHAASTTIELAPQAVVLISEIACVPREARVSIRTIVRREGRELMYDAVDAGRAAPRTVGTFAIVGIDAGAIEGLAGALDALADTLGGATIGLGRLDCGVFARVLDDDPWTVRSILEQFRGTAANQDWSSAAQ